MREIKFVSIDSSLANTGIAIGNIVDDNIFIVDTFLTETKKTKIKQVRASSDSIARCKQTYDFVHNIIKHIKPQLIIIETPSGSQSASGMKSYGSTCMLIASLKPAPIEVTPMEVKLASVGHKKANKAQMIKWASDKYPKIKWLYHAGKLQNKNEHIADAIAIAHAGILTKEFNRIKNINL